MKNKKLVNILIVSLIAITTTLSMAPNLKAQDEDIVFIMGTMTEWTSLDPLTHSMPGDYDVNKHMIGESLYWLEAASNYPNREAIPWLVEEEVVWRDGLKINITLKDGISFANGNPLNASVVEWNMLRNFYGMRMNSLGTLAGAANLHSWVETDLDAFLAIPEFLKYNDSDLYPELWWNKNDSRLMPVADDGTNITNLENLRYPEEMWTGWLGRPIWTPEEVYVVTNETTGEWEYQNLTGNTGSGSRSILPFVHLPEMGYPGVISYPDEPMKLTIQLSTPVWPMVKYIVLTSNPIIFPTGTYNTTAELWNYDGPGFNNDTGYAPNMWNCLDMGNDNWTHVIGTGMFKYAGWDEVERVITMAKNDDYWGGNWEAIGRLGPLDPEMDVFIYKSYTDAAAMHTALLDGEVDFVNGISADYYDAINAADSGVHLLAPVATQGSEYLYLRPGDGAAPGYPDGETMNKTIRRALNFAFNYDNWINNSATERVRNKGPWWTSPGSSLWDDNRPVYPGQAEDGYFYNITEARRILIDEGAVANRGLTLESPDQDWINVANGDNPIANISFAGRADIPDQFTQMNTYFSLAGINCYMEGDQLYAVGDWIGKLVAARFDHELVHMELSGEALNIHGWHFWWQDYLGLEDGSSENIFAWNIHPVNCENYSLPNDNTDWVATLPGYSSYEPTGSTIMTLWKSLRLQGNEIQLAGDLAAFYHWQYDDPLFIWISSAVYREALSDLWYLPDYLHPQDAKGWLIYDFKMVLDEPFVIPGFSPEILFGVSVLAVLSLATIIKKRKI